MILFPNGRSSCMQLNYIPIHDFCMSRAAQKSSRQPTYPPAARLLSFLFDSTNYGYIRYAKK